MKRALDRLDSERFDLVVIGGGVYGLAAAREAALRGLSVAVVEKNDFGQATSAASLKLIHGGLRYLQHLNFHRMRISIGERHRMLALAPHLVHPIEFIIPCYGHGMRGPEALRLAFLANDALSWDRNQGLDSMHRIPPGRMLSPSECRTRLPGIPVAGLTGGGSFCDAQMYSSERLTLAYALAANERGAALANRMEVIGFDRTSDRIQAVRALDRESGRTLSVAGDFFLNMTGPWIEHLASMLHPSKPDSVVLRSKGIQLVTPSISEVGFPIESRQKDVTARIQRGGRNYFVTPWRGRSLIGTTDTLFKGDPSSFTITESDISAFLKELREIYPSADLSRKDVLFWIGGLRPLGDEDDRPDVAQASHQMQRIDHWDRDGVNNLLSVTGVKYTVARHVAESMISLIVQRLRRGEKAGIGRRTPLPGGDIPVWDTFLKSVARESGHSLSISRHLAHLYGTQWRQVTTLGHLQPDWLTCIAGSEEVIRAEVVHAVREEMALHLTDVLLRRTDLGTLGNPGELAIRECADLMAMELGWTPERTGKEIQEAQSIYTLAP